MKFLRICGVVFVILIALLCVGLVHGASVLPAIESSSLSENFVKNVREKLKPAALEALSLSEFNNPEEANKALQNLEMALASFRKEFGSQLSGGKAISSSSGILPMPTSKALGQTLSVDSDEEDNEFKAPIAALGGTAGGSLPSISGISTPEPILPPAAISSSVPVALPGSPLPAPVVNMGTPTPGQFGLPALAPLGSLPAITPVGGPSETEEQMDEGADFGGGDLGGGLDLPSLDLQDIGLSLPASSPAPLPSLGVPVVAPLPGVNPVPSVPPAINPLPTPSPAPKPLVVPSIAPLPMTLPPIVKAELASDISVVTRKSKKIKSLDKKMDKMMVLGSVFQEASVKKALAQASREEQSKNFDLMSLNIDMLPKIVTNDTLVGLEKASVALAGLGDLE